MDKARLAILLNIQGNRNPALLFCLKYLSNDYQITVICPDAITDTDTFPDVEFINYAPLTRWTSRLIKFFSYALIKPFQLAGLISASQWKFRAENLSKLLSYIFIEMSLLPVLYAQSLLKASRFSGIICIDAGAMTAARIVRFVKKIEYVYWTYEIYPNQFEQQLKLLERLMSWVERRGCASAYLVVVTSNVWAKLLRRRYRLYELKHSIVCICPPPVKNYADLEVKKNIKFYYHGGYQKGRGIKNLIRSMQQIEGGELYLRGIGAAYEAELKAETRRLELDDKITFLPPVPTEELAETATKFDVGVIMACMTTANARFLIGFKTFENLAAGIPLFAPPSFQLKEIVNNHQVGIIYADCSENEIAKALRYCISHKEEITFWKKNARTLAQIHYSAHAQQANLKTVIDSLID